MAVPGWYADPWRQAALRYWDGAMWTGHVHPGVVPPPVPAPGPRPAEAGRAINRAPLAWYLASALVVVVGVSAAALSWALSR